MLLLINGILLLKLNSTINLKEVHKMQKGKFKRSNILVLYVYKIGCVVNIHSNMVNVAKDGINYRFSNESIFLSSPQVWTLETDRRWR